MSDLNSLRGPGRPSFNPPPAVPPLALAPEAADDLTIPEAAPAAGSQGDERLLDAGAANYGRLPWDETLPNPAAAPNAVARAKAWGQRLIQGL